MSTVDVKPTNRKPGAKPVFPANLPNVPKGPAPKGPAPKGPKKPC